MYQAKKQYEKIRTSINNAISPSNRLGMQSSKSQNNLNVDLSCKYNIKENKYKLNNINSVLSPSQNQQYAKTRNYSNNTLESYAEQSPFKYKKKLKDGEIRINEEIIFMDTKNEFEFDKNKYVTLSNLSDNQRNSTPKNFNYDFPLQQSSQLKNQLNSSYGKPLNQSNHFQSTNRLNETNRPTFNYIQILENENFELKKQLEFKNQQIHNQMLGQQKERSYLDEILKMKDNEQYMLKDLKNKDKQLYQMQMQIDQLHQVKLQNSELAKMLMEAKDKCQTLENQIKKQEDTAIQDFPSKKHSEIIEKQKFQIQDQQLNYLQQIENLQQQYNQATNNIKENYKNEQMLLKKEFQQQVLEFTNNQKEFQSVIEKLQNENQEFQLQINKITNENNEYKKLEQNLIDIKRQNKLLQDQTVEHQKELQLNLIEKQELNDQIQQFSQQQSNQQQKESNDEIIKLQKQISELKQEQQTDKQNNNDEAIQKLTKDLQKRQDTIINQAQLIQEYKECSLKNEQEKQKIMEQCLYIKQGNTKLKQSFQSQIDNSEQNCNFLLNENNALNRQIVQLKMQLNQLKNEQNNNGQLKTVQEANESIKSSVYEENSQQTEVKNTNFESNMMHTMKKEENQHSQHYNKKDQSKDNILDDIIVNSQELNQIEEDQINCKNINNQFNIQKYE